jgi:hypothetical protein
LNPGNVPKPLPAGAKTEALVGVEAQVFTIVNDEDYFYPNLMWGAVKGIIMNLDCHHTTKRTTVGLPLYMTN